MKTWVEPLPAGVQWALGGPRWAGGGCGFRGGGRRSSMVWLEERCSSGLRTQAHTPRQGWAVPTGHLPRWPPSPMSAHRPSVRAGGRPAAAHLQTVATGSTPCMRSMHVCMGGGHGGHVHTCLGEASIKHVHAGVQNPGLMRNREIAHAHGLSSLQGEAVLLGRRLKNQIMAPQAVGHSHGPVPGITTLSWPHNPQTQH